jgi:hypothetical protein
VAIVEAEVPLSQGNTAGNPSQNDPVCRSQSIGVVCSLDVVLAEMVWA